MYSSNHPRSLSLSAGQGWAYSLVWLPLQTLPQIVCYTFCCTLCMQIKSAGNKSLSSKSIYFKCTMLSLALPHTLTLYPPLHPFTHSLSQALQYLFYYYIHFDTSSDVGPVFVSIFFPFACSCLLCALMSMLCLKGLGCCATPSTCHAHYCQAAGALVSCDACGLCILFKNF